MSQKTIGDLYTEDPASLPLDGTEQIGLEQSAASAGALVSDIRARPTVAKSGDYTITGREDAHVIAMTTGSSDYTVDLPNSSSDDIEVGDEFEIHKVDAGSGKVSFARQGSDTIDGETSIDCDSQYDHAKVRYLGGGLYTLIEYKDHGSAAAGDWQRLANGTMEQSGEDSVPNTSTGYGNAFISAKQIVTFPKAFLAATTPSVVVTGFEQGVVNAPIFGGGEGCSNTAFEYWLMTLLTNSNALYGRWQATGRWRT
jgi:hypothetical protein